VCVCVCVCVPACVGIHVAFPVLRAVNVRELVDFKTQILDT